MQLLCKALALVGYEHHRCQYGQKSISLLEQNFIQHIQEYGLRFGTKEEYEFRFQLYKQIDAEINEINERQNQFKLGHNRFSTMTKFESNGGRTIQEPPSFQIKEPTYLEEKELLDGFDWRNYGAINPVRDQGTCQASWAFAQASSIEAEYFIKNQRQLLQLSPQQFIDCYTPSLGCKEAAINFNDLSYAQYNALLLESVYPYNGTKQSCTVTPPKEIVKIDDFIQVPSQRAYQLLAAISERPVIVNWLGSYVKFYKSGILNLTDSNCGDYSYYGQMLAVGYGTEQIHKGKYYILQSSWGTQWGEQGYIRIAADEKKLTSGTCDVQINSYYPVIF